MKTISPKLKKEITLLPNSPGVYLFKDVAGAIIYIGKAAKLKARVRSYWNENSWRERPKLAVMVPKVELLETILTNSEKEALLLEANLVKKHLPRYNVTLKDGKRYPWLAITYDESFPRLIMVRDPAKFKKENPKSKLFGPYVEASAMWETVQILRKVFPMRQRRIPLFKDRPCMNYQIGLCLGPCQNLVAEDTYNQMVEQVELFLSGQQSEVIKQLKKEMEDCSNRLEYEQASKIRNRLFALQKVIEKQQVYFDDQSISYDVLSEAHSLNSICICLQRIREGKLISSETFNLQLTEKTSPSEAFQTFVDQYYAAVESVDIPKEVILQNALDDINAISELLCTKAHRQVSLVIPSRGRKQKLVSLASKNAKQVLDRQTEYDWQQDTKATELLSKLQAELNLTKQPKRIECFDISNIQGSDNVASMIVFENAKAKKSDYRRFKVKAVEGKANDFASMEEVVGRRYRRLLEENKDMPDLIIIDGGKGQLNAALQALSSLELKDLNIIGLAKKQEEIYFPGKNKPVLLPRNSETLHLLQQARDEAHRFAVTFHRKLRAKRVINSEFDTLPSVGKVRRKILFDHFGSFSKLKEASLDELNSVSGIPASVAQAIYNSLHGQ